MDSNTNGLDTLYFILSGILACSIYALLVILIFFILTKNDRILISINTQSVINSLEVNIIEDVEKVNKNINNNIKYTKDYNLNKDLDIGSNSPIPGLNPSELFKKINTNKPNDVVKENIVDSKDSVAINKKGSNEGNKVDPNKISNILSKTSSILNTIDNLNKNMVVLDSGVSNFCNKYYEYCKNIQNILYSSWNVKDSFDEKLSVVAFIKISKNGEFGYTINKYSGNNDFDNSLIESLDNLKNVVFPTINDENLNISITFTNKKGD